MMAEPRGEEQGLRGKFMLIFRGGAVSRHDLSPSELQSLDDAIDVARTCPAYELGGSVEVRPVQDNRM